MTFIKHKEHKDVCLKVVTNHYNKASGDLHIVALFWNLGHSTSYSMGISQTLIINENNAKDWYLLQTSNTKSLRNQNWAVLEDLSIIP